MGRTSIWARCTVLLGLIGSLAAAPAGGQSAPASLLADEVTYSRDTGLLTARGDVEVLYEGRVLRAAAIVYDERADEIRATGPLVITDATGVVILADAAAMTPDLSEGLIEGARLLIAEKMQLAASEVRRTGGRYTSLYRTIVSSCTVCAGNPTPTWAIRASRVTLDEVDRRIYIEGARLEAFGLPIGYLPLLSIPDPTVRRASGVLVPSFLQSDIYGFGFKLPYYRVLGPSADATVTPFVTSTGAFLLEGEYRRRFDNGGFDVWGVIALDDGLDDDLGGNPGRGSARAVGEFALRHGFVTDFDLNWASDDSFLQQFDYSDADQLTSIARLRRTDVDSHFDLATLGFQSLRDDEDKGTIPFVVPRFSYRHLSEVPGVGGRLGIEANSLGITREVGRDMFRLGGGADWRNDWTLWQGFLAGATLGADVDLYRTWDDPDLPTDIEVRTVPTAAVELRWPLLKSDGRAAHVLEPIVQVAYSRDLGADDADLPNEDSQLPSLDETNLFALNRFPGQDRQETGLRANLGLSYVRHDPSGWSLGFTGGRIVRTEAVEGFYEGTGLAGRWSDYVAAVYLDFAWGLSVVNRALLDDDFTFQRNEIGIAYTGDRGALRAAYIFLPEDDSDPRLGLQPETNELALDARYRFHPNWEMRGLWRYDVATGSNLRAGGELRYGNECTEVDLSVSRRYTSSSNLPPSTSIGFNVRLAGVGAAGDWDWPARSCPVLGL